MPFAAAGESCTGRGGTILEKRSIAIAATALGAVTALTATRGQASGLESSSATVAENYASSSKGMNVDKAGFTSTTTTTGEALPVRIPFPEKTLNFFGLSLTTATRGR